METSSLIIPVPNEDASDAEINAYLAAINDSGIGSKLVLSSIFKHLNVVDVLLPREGGD